MMPSKDWKELRDTIRKHKKEAEEARSTIITVSKVAEDTYEWTAEVGEKKINGAIDFATARDAAGDAVDSYYRRHEKQLVPPVTVLFEDHSRG